jgi:branched-chain amino acid transport system ATP-binding protein
LDQISLRIAPKIVGELFRILREINGDGTTVLLMEQNIKRVLKVSSHAYVLETGMIVHRGPMSELRNAPKIMESYLGGMADMRYNFCKDSQKRRNRCH